MRHPHQDKFAGLVSLGLDDEWLDQKKLQKGNRETCNSTRNHPAGQQGSRHVSELDLSVAGKAGGVAGIMCCGMQRI